MHPVEAASVYLYILKTEGVADAVSFKRDFEIGCRGEVEFDLFLDALELMRD